MTNEGAEGTGAGSPAYRHAFRHYQTLALEAFERSRAEGRKRCYVVMPPGSGKTVLGLEMARRLGGKAAIFGPNTAIQSQWLAQSADFEPPLDAGPDAGLTAQLTVLTYQALCNFDSGDDPAIDGVVDPRMTASGVSSSGDQVGSTGRQGALPDVVPPQQTPPQPAFEVTWSTTPGGPEVVGSSALEPAAGEFIWTGSTAGSTASMAQDPPPGAIAESRSLALPTSNAPADTGVIAQPASLRSPGLADLPAAPAPSVAAAPAVPAAAVAPAAPADRLDRADSRAVRRLERRSIARGDDREALLALLHPNGRALLDRIAAAGEVTLVLDECHHLLEMWGELVEALVETLGEHAFVVGLTATPPGEMDSREAELYERLFGRADFEVVTPAVVKEGDLAPYQELAFITEPLPHERDYIAGQETRFEELVTDILDPGFATRPFLDWLDGRIGRREVSTNESAGAGLRTVTDGPLGAVSPAGVATTLGPAAPRIGWDCFERDEPELSTAALRLLLSLGATLPEGAQIRERHRQRPTADDWALLIDDYCREFLRHSRDPQDARAWEAIHRALPAVGYVLTRSGVRKYASPVDRVLALSASKGAAAQQILDLEHQQLGSNLRALVLCDFEKASVEPLAELQSVLDPQAGSASLILQLLLADPVTRDLDPILLTGRTVACSRATAMKLASWSRTEDSAIGEALSAGALGGIAGDDMPSGVSAGGLSAGGVSPAVDPAAWQDVVVLDPPVSSWVPRRYVPLVTAFFEQGGSRCLVGTRGLLGEGWDARSVNVLIDLTGAATSVSVHQMRGRSLRLDPNIPQKVADNWDVVCVAPGHPKGLGDYFRFVRKHRAYYALTSSGEIEGGVSHVDPVLSPFGPPGPDEVGALNARTLARVARREEAYTAWRIGQPYRNVETETVRIRFTREIGLPVARAAEGATAFRVRWLPPVVVGALVLMLLVSTSSSITAIVLGAVVLAGIMAGLLGSSAAAAGRLGPSDALEDMAAALAEALATTGGIDRGLAGKAVRIVVQPDGYYRCYLEGASTVDAATFAAALDELFASLDAPRYIISRTVVEPAGSRLGVIAQAVALAFTSRLGRVVYHAVPSYLGANKSRALAFEESWNRYVGGGQLLYCQDPLAQGILAVARGEDPYGTLSQMRTLWK